MPIKTHQTIKADLIKGLSAAKSDIVAILLSDFQTVVPDIETLQFCAGREYEDAFLLTKTIDTVKMKPDNRGRLHRHESSKLVDVQREVLLSVLKETPQERESRFAAMKAEAAAKAKAEEEGAKVPVPDDDDLESDDR